MTAQTTTHWTLNTQRVAQNHRTTDKRDNAASARVSSATIESYLTRARSAQGELHQRFDRGELGFFQLARRHDHADAVTAYLQGDRFSSIEPISDVLLLGIGGSSLGPRSIIEALRPKPARRIHFLDNSDPTKAAHLLDDLDAKRTLVVLVSKSGGTTETMALWFLVKPWLEAHLEENWRERVVTITDPERGALREMTENTGLSSLPIPPNVGGRFSVLSPVGLLPAALAGVDPHRLVSGAQLMADHIVNDREDNLSLWLATALCAQHQELQRHIHVLMPYADGLKAFSEWFVQLWAESLGKIDTKGAHVGPTPISAVGATDQHAQVQLFMEGPRDKVVLLLDVEHNPHDRTLGQCPAPFELLSEQSLHQLLRAQCESTAQALEQVHRPSLTLTLGQLDEYHLGGLFLLFEHATAIAASLYDVDAFDQPGVELGKHLTKKRLGEQSTAQYSALGSDATPSSTAQQLTVTHAHT